ncbi:MAG: hypothetical protein H6713_04525 [Myxococcales bacterium]|nr:hypothetical protein [Myxococcales bacterium]
MAPLLAIALALASACSPEVCAHLLHCGGLLLTLTGPGGAPLPDGDYRFELTLNDPHEQPFTDTWECAVVGGDAEGCLRETSSAQGDGTLVIQGESSDPFALRLLWIRAEAMTDVLGGPEYVAIIVRRDGETLLDETITPDYELQSVGRARDCGSCEQAEETRAL